MTRLMNTTAAPSALRNTLCCQCADADAARMGAARMMPLLVGLAASLIASAAAAACDLASCTCDGVDLSGMKGKVYQAPTDAEGYAYKISMCSEIPTAQLPTGCKQYAEHPAVVKYKANNPADCIEIGSVGPCSQGACGMAGAKTSAGVTVTYTYTYGCKNTFALSLTSGSDAAPGAVTSNECAYTVAWAGLNGASSGGGSAGGPGQDWGMFFLIFFFLAAGGYVGGGMFYNHKYNGEKMHCWPSRPAASRCAILGAQLDTKRTHRRSCSAETLLSTRLTGEKMPSLEAVPNLEFWKELPVCGPKRQLEGTLLQLRARNQERESGARGESERESKEKGERREIESVGAPSHAVWVGWAWGRGWSRTA